MLHLTRTVLEVLSELTAIDGVRINKVELNDDCFPNKLCMTLNGVSIPHGVFRLTD